MLDFPPQRPLLFSELRFDAPLKIAVLAPHPDDFDAIAVSLRFLHEQGHEIHVAVLTTGASGVEDGFGGAHTAGEKAAVREAEQQESCRFFGLPENRLRFLRLWDGGDEAGEHEKLRAHVLGLKPDLVFLPHGNDSNATHRRTYENFRSIAQQDKLQLWACLNRDTKTLTMRADLYMHFGEKEAVWKALLLRLHRSQQERNLNTRNIGFDERVLALNRKAAEASGMPYAEVFELERFG